MLKVVAALLAAAIMPAVVAGISARSIDFGVIVFLIALVHLVVLGIPVYLIGWITKTISLWSTLVAAFVIGAGPSTILLWLWPEYPYSPKNAFEIFRFVSMTGFFGAIGGLTFWLIWRYWFQAGPHDGN